MKRLIADLRCPAGDPNLLLLLTGMLDDDSDCCPVVEAAVGAAAISFQLPLLMKAFNQSQRATECILLESLTGWNPVPVLYWQGTTAR